MPTMSEEPKESIEPGVYRHFKGGYYLVLFSAVHSETREEYVVYRPLYNSGEAYVVRPRAMFEEKISPTQHRFEFAT
jgi:hypothetical protein